MGQTQSDLKAIELKMADPSIYSDIAGFQLIEKDYQSKQQVLKQMNQDYDQLFSELLEIESK
jgi:Flp pilus assembly protein TadD